MTEKTITETIEIRGQKYPKPSIDNLRRSDVKRLKPLTKDLEGNDLEALWSLIELLIPGLDADVLDDLTIGECKAIIQDAGLANFDEAEAAAVEGAITVGESSASTGS